MRKPVCQTNPSFSSLQSTAELWPKYCFIKIIPWSPGFQNKAAIKIGWALILLPHIWFSSAHSIRFQCVHSIKMLYSTSPTHPELVSLKTHARATSLPYFLWDFLTGNILVSFSRNLHSGAGICVSTDV